MQAGQEVEEQLETCKAKSVPISASSPQATRSALANSFLPGQLSRASTRACLQEHGLLENMGSARVLKPKATGETTEYEEIMR